MRAARQFSIGLVTGGLSLAMLSGCAAMHTLQAQVHAYSNWPAGRAPGTYAFERLPSQQAQAEQQAELEAAAASALSAAGFERAQDDAPQLLVQISAGARQTGALLDDSWGGLYGPGLYPGRGAWGGPGWVGPGFIHQTPVVTYHADVLIRERSSHQVLYESQAWHERIGGSKLPAQALFTAALKLFPHPSAGTQSVTVDLAR